MFQHKWVYSNFPCTLENYFARISMRSERGDARLKVVSFLPPQCTACLFDLSAFTTSGSSAEMRLCYKIVSRFGLFCLPVLHVLYVCLFCLSVWFVCLFELSAFSSSSGSSAVDKALISVSEYSCPCLVVPNTEELISRPFKGLWKIRLLLQDRLRSKNVRN